MTICSVCLDPADKLYWTFCAECPVCVQCRVDIVNLNQQLCPHNLPYYDRLITTGKLEDITTIKLRLDRLKSYYQDLKLTIDKDVNKLKIQLEREQVKVRTLTFPDSFRSTLIEKLNLLYQAEVKNLQQIIDHNDAGLAIVNLALTRYDQIKHLPPKSKTLSPLDYWRQLYHDFNYPFIREYNFDYYLVFMRSVIKINSVDFIGY